MCREPRNLIHTASEIDEHMGATRQALGTGPVGHVGLPVYDWRTTVNKGT